MLADSFEGLCSVHMIYVRKSHRVSSIIVYTVRTQYITQNSESESKNPELRIECEK